MTRKKGSENKKFFDDFIRSNSEKIKDLADLKRSIEEFEFKRTEQTKSEKVVYSFCNYS